MLKVVIYARNGSQDAARERTRAGELGFSRLRPNSDAQDVRLPAFAIPTTLPLIARGSYIVMFSGLRVALVVGADDYQARPLSNCVADARAVVTALETRGFKCTLLKNPTLEQLRVAVQELRFITTNPEMSLFYFAGHALEYGGSGFLLPCDYPDLASALSLKHYAMPVATVCDAVNVHGGKFIAILDACRLWGAYTPDVDRLAEHIHSTGIAQRKWDNTVIAYSTSAGDAAPDGVAGRNSRYCLEFCKLLTRHDLTVEDCFRLIGQVIINNSGSKQRPWYYSSLRAQVGFSDLATFELITAHKLPFDADSLLCLSPGFTPSSVLVAGRKPHLWEVDASGFWRVSVGSVGSVGKIVGACTFKGGTVLIDEEGNLAYSNKKRSLLLKTCVKYPHGILTDGNSDVLVYGMDGWAIYRIIRRSWCKIAHRETSWSIHTGTLISSRLAWLGGSLGHLEEIDWDGELAIREISDIHSNINTLCLLPNDSILCGGDSGFLVNMDVNPGSIIKDFQRDESVTTASRRRQSLINRLDNGRILRYLFDRDSINPAINEVLDRCLEQCRVMFAHAAPTLPLIICGNSEGIVEVIDTRDGQTFQRIDDQSGLGTDIQGVRFLSDTEFVTLSNAGVVRFYASRSPHQRHSGPFLQSDEEDRLLIQQGLNDA